MTYKGKMPAVPLEVRRQMRYSVVAGMNRQGARALLVYCESYDLTVVNHLTMQNALVETHYEPAPGIIFDLSWTRHSGYTIGGSAGTWYWSIRPLDDEELAYMEREFSDEEIAKAKAVA